MPRQPGVDWPVLVVAQKPAGAGSCATAGDWKAFVDFLAWSEGHGYCGGCVFDLVTERVRCACGTDLFQVSSPVLDPAMLCGHVLTVPPDASRFISVIETNLPRGAAT